MENNSNEVLLDVFKTHLKDFTDAVNARNYCSCHSECVLTDKIYNLQLFLETINNCKSLWQNCESCCICLEQSFDFVALFGCARHWVCVDCASKLILKSKTLTKIICCPQCRDPSGLSGLSVIPHDILLYRNDTPRIRLEMKKSKYYYSNGVAGGENSIINDVCVKREYQFDYMVFCLLCENQKKIYTSYATRKKQIQEQADLRKQISEQNHYIGYLQNLLVYRITEEPVFLESGYPFSGLFNPPNNPPPSPEF